ncbi:apolipoprotein N-acyltransferase [Streptomyces sp. NPDC053493]|uniref:apolipoprotein N-acyltransferase n=1 Tax=Streptomyces sp. NPDC053493 TaxID=3365705 RepID=UPI0037D2A456
MRIPFARRTAAAAAPDTEPPDAAEPAPGSGASGEPGSGSGSGGSAVGAPAVVRDRAPASYDARRARPGRAERLGRSLLAVVLGALPALAFPAPGLWWWAYLSLVPWLLLIRTAPDARRAGLDGWLGGAGFMLAVHHWLLPSLHVFLLVLAALLGLLWLPWGRLVWSLLGGTPSARRAAAALLVVPSGWLLVELVRSWQGLGGPWGLLGASQWQVPPALRLASVGGVWLVSLLVVAVNTAVALLLAVPPARRTAVAGLTGGAVVAGLAWWGAGPADASGTVRIAVVQPGVLDGPGGADRRFARAEELTRTLVGQRLDLVVWGESSVGADLGARPDLAARLTVLARAVDAPVLVNVDARRSDRAGIYKSAILVGRQGPTGERYDKMRLVPFGEYVPARAVLGWATSVGKAAGEDRRRGTAPVVMSLSDGPVAAAAGRDAAPSEAARRDAAARRDGPGAALADLARPRIGPLVCFETAFPDMSRALVRGGADVLVAQSSTSTFQDSWAPAQHASLGALRAAETGRPMVHATLTGISAAYAPDGRRVGPVIGTGSGAAAVYELPLSHGTTVYAGVGDWPVYGAVAVVALTAAAAGAGRFGGQRFEGPRSPRP